MKFVPDAIARKGALAVLHARKNSPSLLFGAGVVSMVGSTVLACRATLKLDEVLDVVERDIYHADKMREAEPDSYSEKERKKDVTVVYLRSAGKVARLYAPSVVLGVGGIVCLTKSHNILKDRNVALTAAYAAVNGAFDRYRERVVAEYGEEVDKRFIYETEEIDVIDEETGEIVTTIRATSAPGGKYARFFDSRCSSFSAPPYEEYNWLFLRQQQLFCNDLLRSRGHVFLNEVYSALGMEHTTDGAIVGWVYDPHNDLKRRPEDDVSDNYIDFGCWDQSQQLLEPDDLFNNGEDGAVLLNFNVDGPIWDLLDKLSAARKGGA